MLKTPINVYPSNGEVIYIDKTRNADNTKYKNAPVFTFTFQGDLLSWIQGETYNTNTNELIYWSYCPSDGTMYTVHNNTQMRMSEQVLAYHGVNGQNYKYRYRLFQNDPQTGAPLCDMYIARGKVQQTSSNSTEIIVQKDIKNIHAPYYFNYDNNPNSDGHLIGCIYMEIGLERRMITDYNSSTGVVTIASAFNETPTEGTPFKLFCNYIETGFYDFRARYMPQVTLSARANYDGLYCTATYSQANYVGLKSYKFNIYDVGSDTGRITGKTQSNYDESSTDNLHIPIEAGIVENIVGKNITFNFIVNDEAYSETKCIDSYNSTDGELILKSALSVVPPPETDYYIVLANETLIETMDNNYSYDLTETFPIHINGQTYRIECETVTQEDCHTTTSIYKTFAESSITEGEISSFIINGNTDYHYVTIPVISIKWTNSVANHSNYIVWRKDIDTNETIYIGDISSGNTFYDYTIANNHRYKYIFTARCMQGLGRDYETNEIVTSWDGWYITGIDFSGNKQNRNVYTPNETWHFINSINSGNITKNINLTTHISTSAYVQTSRDNTKYESGSFTANLLTIECPYNELVDDINRVQRWMSFISNNKTFILKSDKGDIWAINISNNPSRTYDETLSPILTNISYDWVEVDDMKNIVVKN